MDSDPTHQERRRRLFVLQVEALLEISQERLESVRLRRRAARGGHRRHLRKRETDIDVAPIAFTPELTEQRQRSRSGARFRGRLPNTESPAKLTELVTPLTELLLPIAHTCASGESFDERWSPGGPWTTRRMTPSTASASAAVFEAPTAAAS